MSNQTARNLIVSEFKHTVLGKSLDKASKVLLISTFLTVVNACGKTDSFGSLSSAKSASNGSSSVDKTKSVAPGQAEDQTADAPQSIAGMYLTCGDYSPTKEDASKDSSIGCHVSNASGQRVAMQNLAQRKWTVKNKDGDELSPVLQETSDSVRIFATHNTGGPDDVKTVELEAKIQNSNKPLEKIRFTFADSVRQLTLAGLWNVTRTAPSGSSCFGVSIRNPQLNAGKLEITPKLAGTNEFTAVVSGGPFTLDYDGARSLPIGSIGLVSKSAAAGTPIFSAVLDPASKRAQAAAASGQTVLPPDLNRTPTLEATTGADGSIVSLRMHVMQPCYGLTYWDFKK